MKKLHLQIDQKIQGDFEPKNLNLMIVFQANCPGCIASALPLVQDLYDVHHQEIGFLGLSTAFQHYDKNNAENTRRLVEDGYLVGHSKEIMEQHGYEKLPYKITFPVVMDAKLSADNKESVAKFVVEQHPQFEQFNEIDRINATKRVLSFLDQQGDSFITFTANQFKGSPTFVLFNQDYEIIETWFGHSTKESVLEKIKTAQKN